VSSFGEHIGPERFTCLEFMPCKRVNTTGEHVVTISARILESQLREIDKLARLRVVLKDCFSMTILYPRRNKY